MVSTAWLVTSEFVAFLRWSTGLRCPILRFVSYHFPLSAPELPEARKASGTTGTGQQ